jgi:hypothetical protein
MVLADLEVLTLVRTVDRPVPLLDFFRIPEFDVEEFLVAELPFKLGLRSLPELGPSAGAVGRDVARSLFLMMPERGPSVMAA